MRTFGRALAAAVVLTAISGLGMTSAQADAAPTVRVPDNVVATTNGDGRVSLRWTNTGADYYIVYYYSAIAGGYTNRQVFGKSTFYGDMAWEFTGFHDEWTTMCLYAIDRGNASASVCSQAFLPYYSHPVHPFYSPSVTMTDLTEAEGTGLHTALVAVNLSSPSEHNITFGWATESRTAQGGGDFVNDNGQVVIPAGSTQALIPIRIKGDRSVEQNETLRVNITSLDNASVTDRSALVTLQNDD